MYEAYRAVRQFNWRGWVYAPDVGTCQCSQDPNGCSAYGACTGQVASSCGCKGSICRCDCGILRERYAGDVWLVEAGHPRKAMMLAHRFAIYDASLPSGDELAQEKKFARFLEQYQEKELIASRSR